MLTTAFAQTESESIRTCAYDPDSGQPNPLGMRAFITATEQDGNTTFRFEQFPSPVGGERPGVTLASRRELTFYNINVEEARQLLLKNPQYYTELVGYEDDEGFARVNKVLVCRTRTSTSNQSNSTQSNTGSQRQSDRSSQNQTTTNTQRQSDRPAANQQTPASSRQSAQAATNQPSGANGQSGQPNPNPPISNLSDGNYRYWSGQTTNVAITDEELLKQGGTLFLFRKEGDQVVGSFSYIDGEAICIRGTLKGNTVTGQAFPYDNTVNNTGETFTAWGPSRSLQVRRGVEAGSRSRYEGALLNLTNFSRINAGRQMPPRSCR